MSWYATAIFVSAMLLFEVQPIVARMLLPRLGGSAAVWTTCLLFFQTGLLAGYFHAWWTQRYLAPRNRALLHAQLLGLLVRTIGMPYVLLSSTGPLLQDWFAARFPGRDPYRLFALSNFASLLALLAYPVVIEPHLGVAAQARAWSVCYALFVVLGVTVALRARALPPSPHPSPAPTPPAPAPPVAESAPSYFQDPAPALGELTPGGRALWVVLPGCATLLLLALTTYLTEDLAAIPLLWVLPLAVYLVTFILAFARRQYYHRPVFRPLVAAQAARPAAYRLLLVDLVRGRARRAAGGRARAAAVPDTRRAGAGALG